MFISLSRTYIQNFSNWNALFVLFFLSHSVAVVAWCGTQRVDPQMVHFELFYHLVRRSQEPGARSQEPVQPPDNICSLSAAGKNTYFGRSSKNDNHPGPLPQQGFCTSPEN